MTTLQKTLVGATLAVAVGTGLYQTHQAGVWRDRARDLERQMSASAKPADTRSASGASDADIDVVKRQLAVALEETERLRRDNADLSRLRNEATQLREQIRALNTGAVMARTGSPPVAAVAALTETAQAIGAAVARGEAGAFEKLLELSRSQQAAFATNPPGLPESRRGELAAQTYAPLRAAFKVIGESATNGGSFALDALARAVTYSELRGFAVSEIGVLAGAGDASALQLLLNPKDHGIPLASTVSALQPAADSGNPLAIEAIAAVTREPKNQPLWYLAAKGLTHAAESGNATAIEALVGIASCTNASIRGAVVAALKRAAPHSPEAVETLRALNLQ